MSQTQTDAEQIAELLGHYAPGTGDDRYARFCEDVLGITRTWVLEQLSEALNTHSQVIAIGGNGVGKSYDAGGLGVAATFTNADTVTPITAGNGDTVTNSIWKPIKNFHHKSGLPGRTLDNTRELRTEFDEEWYLQCLSPRHPEDLEGDHNETVIYIIEEAEKPGVTDEHIDSARSTLTSENDRLLVLANPPTDEANVVNRLIADDEWHTLIFPSWESHNIRIDRGLEEGEKIDGLSTAYKLRKDWEEYHDDPWPGLERAIEVSTKYLDADGNLTQYEREAERENPEFRENLHERWYKRRAGIVPPEGSDTWRPFHLSDVDAGYKRKEAKRLTPMALGVDVADKSDRTKAFGMHDDVAVQEYDSQQSLPEQQSELVEKIREWPEMDGCVDGIGRGAQLAQELAQRFPGFAEFGNNEVPADEQYRNKWTYGLHLIGEWLDNGGAFHDADLYEELKVAARTVKFSRNHLKSRGKIVEATSKEDVKQALGRSPDSLDALIMALTAKEVDSTDGKASPTFGW